MNSQTDLIRPPGTYQRTTLRTMIVAGIASVLFCLYFLLKKENIGQPFLYYLLMASLFYMCLHMLVEWYYYFSISVPTPPATYRHRTVDVFTTYCQGEPYAMIVGTLRAIQAMRYPHTAYLCDEANDPYLRQVCAELGVVHVTRNHRTHAKAGNINNALKQSSGELCLVLDPDHVPVPGMLDEVVPYFEDDQVGYVQIVQAYSNGKESIIAKGAAQQTYQFYGPMMMCMHAYGTAQAIGANCTFRRSALESIGGHAAGLAEDMHTAMQLHAKKWKSVYVPKVLTRGLVPSTLSAYYKQQLKWAKGSFDLFVGTYPKLFRQFTFRQKLHYGLVPLHYLAGLIFLINFVVPVISLFLGVIPLKIDMGAFMLLGIPVILSSVLIRLYVQRWVMEENERGIHIVGGLLQIGTWWIYILALYYAIIGKKVPYDPTPKDGHERNNWPLNIPNLIVALVSIVAIVYGLYYDLNPFSLVMAFLAAMNVLFMIVVMLMSRQSGIRAAVARHKVLVATYSLIKQVKVYFWYSRHRAYALLRQAALPLMAVAITAVVYLITDDAFRNVKGPPAFASERQKPAFASLRNMRLSTGSAVLHERLDLPLDFHQVKGSNYLKASHWFRDFSTLSRRQVEADMDRMKSIGINTIKRIGPGVYDRTILRSARDKQLDVHYGFWIPRGIDFVKDAGALEKLRNSITGTVKKHKYEQVIKAWHLGPDVCTQLQQEHSGEAVRQQYEAAMSWLQTLCADIKKEDPSRPLCLEVEFDEAFLDKADLLSSFSFSLDALSISVGADSLPSQSDLSALKMPYFFSNVDAGHLGALWPATGVFLVCFQDLMTRDYVTFNGLLDHWEREKHAYGLVKRTWGSGGPAPIMPEVGILKPAVVTYSGTTLTYHALARLGGKWTFAAGHGDGRKYEWHLVRTDVYGNPLHLEQIGSGPVVELVIPDSPELWKLHLSVVDKGQVAGCLTTLNTRLEP